jgi:hypothetical protein
VAQCGACTVLVGDRAVRCGARSATKLTYGVPGATCMSINEEPSHDTRQSCYQVGMQGHGAAADAEGVLESSAARTRQPFVQAQRARKLAVQCFDVGRTGQPDLLDQARQRGKQGRDRQHIVRKASADHGSPSRPFILQQNPHHQSEPRAANVDVPR